MSGRVITAGSFPELEGAIRHEIERIGRHDPFARVDVLVGSNLLGIHLKRRLAGTLGGLFNVHFLTFVDLAASLQAGTGEGSVGRLLPLAERVVISDILSADVPSSLREAAKTRGFAASLLETFDDLAEGGCTPALVHRIMRGRDTGTGISERAGDILHLYARYRRRLNEYGDDTHSRFLRAVEECDTGRMGGPLLVYGFYDFNEMQWRLIEAIAAGPGVVLFVPWCGDASHRFAARTMARIERSGFTVERVDHAGSDRCAPERIVFSAPGEEEEAGGIVRRVLAFARDRGLHFGEAGVLLPAVDPYRTLIVEALDDACIPCFTREGAGADGRAPFSGALRLLGLLGGRIVRRALTEFLVTAPLAGHSDDDDFFSLWARMSAEAGVSGAGGWVEENRRLVEMLEQGGGGDDESLRRADAARLVGGVLERLAAARAVFEREATWREYAHTFSFLITELFTPSEDRERVRAVIDQLGELDRFSSPAAYDMFAYIFETALQGLGGSLGHLGSTGVNLLTIGEARGITFRVVFIPGLIERTLPGVVRQDPFLRDEERSALRHLSGGLISLPARMDRLEEEKLMFRLATDAAGETLVCSYPRYEAGTGKALIPSSYLRLLGPPADEPLRDRAMPVRWQTSGEDGAAPCHPASEAEYDLQQAFGVKNGAGSLAPNRFLERGIALVRARWGTRRFTPYDGVFSSRAALRELSDLLDSRGWSFSPTSLEAYAGCPFSYFLGHMLGVAFLEEPERALSITPLQRGNIVHAILARLYDAFRKENLLPLGEGAYAEAAALTGMITNRFLDDYPKHEPVGLPVFWEMERRVISNAIMQLVGEECVDETDYRPAFFEKSFGVRSRAADVSFACADRMVHFHGRIDRIDLGEGARFRVIDYKTGSLDRFKDQELGGGTTLQLPIYLLAASKLLDRPVAAGIAQYWRIGSGRGKRRISYAGETWSEGEPALARILDAITHGIEGGIFCAVPGSDRCSYCAVRSACPSGSARIFERKAANDERCREYLEAREPAREG